MLFQGFPIDNSVYIPIYAGPDYFRERFGWSGGHNGFRVGLLERYVFRKGDQRIGVDYKEGVFQGICNLNECYESVQKVSAQSLRESRLLEGPLDSIWSKMKGDKEKPEKKSDKRRGKTEPEKVTPKSDATAKDILTGSEVFRDAERKIRLFLRAARGSGKQNLFILYGQPGTGKSLAARDALKRECGQEISPKKAQENLYEISFSSSDFKDRLDNHEAREQAKGLYKRYLANYELNKQKGEPMGDPKQKALQTVQDKLQDKLFGYKLTLDDMESDELVKNASDPVMKLKALGGEEARVPYSPSNGWMEGPAHMSNEDLYLQFYKANSKCLFVDEGDYYLSNPNPLMKVALDNKDFRKLSAGTNKGYTEVGGRIIPEEFFYSGRMIITTNLNPRDWDGAIRTRCDKYGLFLTLDQLFSRLRDIIGEIHKNDLPHLPQLLLTGMSNTLRNFAKKGELTTFDYRTFVLLCDEFALILEDEIEAARKENPAIPPFSPYSTTDEALREWKLSEDGARIWTRASNKFRKTLLNQIQSMNRSNVEDPGVIPISSDEEV